MPVSEASMKQQRPAIALEWARATGDPIAAPLAAAYATVLVFRSRALEALAILEPVLASPPAEPEIHAQALLAKAIALRRLGGAADGGAGATAALELVTEDGGRVDALIARTLGHLELDHVKAAIADSEQAIALARSLAPETLSFTLMMAGVQALIQAGQFDLAVALIDEAKQTGADVSHRGPWHDLYADLAIARGSPREAIPLYALALEDDQRRQDANSIYLHLVTFAEVLAMNGDDIEALEVAGMRAGQARRPRSRRPTAMAHLWKRSPARRRATAWRKGRRASKTTWPGGRCRLPRHMRLRIGARMPDIGARPELYNAPVASTREQPAPSLPLADPVRQGRSAVERGDRLVRRRADYRVPVTGRVRASGGPVVQGQRRLRAVVRLPQLDQLGRQRFRRLSAGLMRSQRRW